MSEGHHIIPAKIYTRTLYALLFLTVITVAAAQVDLGSPLNIILAMIIAIVKGSLVCCFFMGLKYDRPLNSVIFACSLIFLFCFFLLTFADLATRGEFDPEKALRDPDGQINYKEVEHKDHNTQAKEPDAETPLHEEKDSKETPK